MIESDHKPLEAIFKKPLHECPVRLQRMRMRLLQYDATIVYKPRKQLYLADALSRVCINDREKLKMHVAMVTESLNITEKQIERFQNETIKDHALQDVIKLVRTGWPEHRNAVPDSAKPYFTFKENLYEANGLLFKKIPWWFQRV